MRSSKVLSAKRLGALKLKIKIKADETNPISILEPQAVLEYWRILGPKAEASVIFVSLAISD